MNGHAAGYELCSALESALTQAEHPPVPGLSARPGGGCPPLAWRPATAQKPPAWPCLTIPGYAKLVLQAPPTGQDHAASGKAAASELHPR